MLKTNPSINSELSGITGVFDIADYEVKGDGSYVITSGASPLMRVVWALALV